MNQLAQNPNPIGLSILLTSLSRCVPTLSFADPADTNPSPIRITRTALSAGRISALQYSAFIEYPLSKFEVYPH
jgi:hypothetical protein